MNEIHAYAASCQKMKCLAYSIKFITDASDVTGNSQFFAEKNWSKTVAYESYQNKMLLKVRYRVLSP